MPPVLPLVQSFCSPILHYLPIVPITKRKRMFVVSAFVLVNVYWSVVVVRITNQYER